jgi:hypothetical protein
MERKSRAVDRVADQWQEQANRYRKMLATGEIDPRFPPGFLEEFKEKLPRMIEVLERKAKWWREGGPYPESEFE